MNNLSLKFDLKKIDYDKLDSAILAILLLSSGYRVNSDVLEAPKSFNDEALIRLHVRGFIDNPANDYLMKFSAKGQEEAEHQFAKLFSVAN